MKDNRRDFIKKSASLLAAASLGRLVPAAPLSISPLVVPPVAKIPPVIMLEVSAVNAEELYKIYMETGVLYVNSE